MSKRFTRLLLCTLAIVAYGSQAQAAVWQGSGTATDPYKVSSAADIVAIGSQLSSSSNYNGVYFLQTADIYFTDADSTFQGIALGSSKTTNFNGVYDGGGHAIHNLKIDGVQYNANGQAVSKGSNTYAGLFGNIGSDGVVENLTIAADCSFKGFRIIGAIAGRNYGRIENCRNYAPVTVISNGAGGIAGQSADTTSVITRCYNAGTITAGFNTVGGITSASEGKVTYCQNDGDVVAGFVNSYKRAGQQYNAGGILASEGQYSYIAYNVNTGNVTGTYVVGGIASVTPTYGSTFVGNINYGSVSYQSPGTNSIGAIIGSETNRDVAMANNYFDKQTGYYDAAGTASHVGATGLTTAELTNGKALEGLDSTQYDWQAGQYPVLAQFKDEAQAKVNRAIIVSLSNAEENIQYFKSNATLSGATYSLKHGGKFAISGNTLSVSGVEEITEADTLVATVGNYTKELPLRSINLSGAFDGEGTAASPFLIKDVGDMQWLAILTNTNNINFKGYYFKVTNDIDCNNVVYDPIAVGGNTFQGDFDGNGKKFTNLTFTISGNNGYRGMFGNVGQYGRVHDVILQSGTLQSYRGTAGIAGKVYGTVDNCENHATITNTSSTGYGGIAGMVWSGGKVTNCRNYANLTVPKTYLGGIAYYVNPDGLIENCANYGNLTGTNGEVGGIAATIDGTIRNCVNYGNITGAGTLAGITSIADGNAVIDHCVNYGSVSAADSTKLAMGASGIVASTLRTEGTVKRISNCANYGDVVANGGVGGILGQAQAGTVITASANYGNLRTFSTSTSEQVGGIAGDLEYQNGYENRITNCFNGGDIDASVSSVGGIVGSLSSEVSNSYNLGNISGKSSVGGIAGATEGTARINGVYSAAKVNGGNINGGGLARISNAYYDNTLNTASNYDGDNVQGVDTRTLTTTQISSAFVLGAGMYPTLTALADSATANWWAATVLPAEGETLQTVTSPLTIGAPAQTVWTSSDNLTVSGNTATPTTNGEGWLTKTLGTLTRTYKVNVVGITGINSANTTKAVSTVRYYDLQGHELSTPQNGVVIKATRYADGTKTVEKQIH